MSANAVSPLQPAMRNRVTGLLRIRYPNIQGGMMWVGRVELAAAVSNAGGLGILTLLPSASPPPYEAYLDAIIDSGVKIVHSGIGDGRGMSAPVLGAEGLNRGTRFCATLEALARGDLQ